MLWYFPAALDAGGYTSSGFHVRRHRQYVRATGLPAPSTWSSAARSSGVMTAVECPGKSDPYWRQGFVRVFENASLNVNTSYVSSIMLRDLHVAASSIRTRPYALSSVTD